jgi:hypothetical protein
MQHCFCYLFLFSNDLTFTRIHENNQNTPLYGIVSSDIIFPCSLINKKIYKYYGRDNQPFFWG